MLARERNVGVDYCENDIESLFLCFCVRERARESSDVCGRYEELLLLERKKDKKGVRNVLLSVSSSVTRCLNYFKVCGYILQRKLAQ